MIRNSRGFATVLFLAFIPILLALVAGVSFFHSFLQVKLLPLQICRMQNLDFQKNSLKIINQLQTTKPLVLELRGELIAANAMVASGVLLENPVIIARGLRWRQTVKRRQKALYVYQQTLLAAHRLEILHSQFETRSQMTTEWSQLRSRLRLFWNIQEIYPQISLPTLAVRPDIKSADPAVYELADDFSNQQSSSISWSSSLQVNSTSWLKDWTTQTTRIRDSCEATIFVEKKELKEGLWRKDKFSSRRLLSSF